jgi:uncharacterized protein involved in outer membrane biogenesis
MLHRRTTVQDDLLRRRRRSSNRSRRRGKFRFGILLRAFCLAAGALLVAYVISPLIWNAERMRPGLQTALSAQLGRETRIGALTFTAGLGAVVATDVTIADDPTFGSTPFVHAQRVTFGIERVPLIFHRKIAVRAIDVEQADIAMIRGVDGKWNFYGILAGDATAADAIPPRVRLSAVTLTVRAGDREEPFVLRDLALDSPAFSATAESALTLSSTIAGGGSLKFRGKAGPVTWNRGSLNVPMNGLVNAKEIGMSDSHLTTALAPAVEGRLSVDANVE